GANQAPVVDRHALQPLVDKSEADLAVDVGLRLVEAGEYRGRHAFAVHVSCGSAVSRTGGQGVGRFAAKCRPSCPVGMQGTEQASSISRQERGSFVTRPATALTRWPHL